MGFYLIEYAIFIVMLVALMPLLGSYIAKVFTGKTTFMHPLVGWLESSSYKLAGINPDEEMSWVTYAKALFCFNLLGFLFLFVLQLVQQWLPLNPQDFPAVKWHTAFNTAISFVTNTNWQSYAGESTLSYLSQMMGLAPQNFLSAATGLATLIALTRGIFCRNCSTIGNFWKDLVRSIVYILLPLSIILAVILLIEGSIQNFKPYVKLTTVEKEEQVIPMGPVASQIAIKQLGTNGGGFFNANSAHPFENPTGLTNFLETLAIMLIPAASIYAFGLLVEAKNHSWIIFGVMGTLWIIGLAIFLFSEYIDNPVINVYPYLEGMESRFGINRSALWSISTTATSNGSVNSMLSSVSPLAGGVALFNIMLGEIIFGGVGVGLCSMIMFILLTVFLAGLMVGRTPEYLGKKIEKKEMQWVMLAILAPGALILIGAGVSSLLPVAVASTSNPGPHGLTEILYAFSSTAGNNGSAFAGLNADTLYYNLFLGVVMAVARVAILLPSLAVAGLLANKKFTPPTVGTFSTSSFLFAVLLISVILIVGALTFFPALSLGPIVEQMLMLEGRAF